MPFATPERLKRSIEAPAVSHYISTRGGQKDTMFFHAPAQDLSQISPVSSTYSMDAVLANTLALDKLANLGVDVSGKTLFDPRGPYNVSDVWASPQAMIGGLWGAAGLDSLWNSGGTPTYTPNEAGTYTETKTPWTLTPEQITALQSPGRRLETIKSIFESLNPNLASTPLGQALARLLPAAGLTSQTISGGGGT